jgi:hypothetical protein
VKYVYQKLFTVVVEISLELLSFKGILLHLIELLYRNSELTVCHKYSLSIFQIIIIRTPYVSITVFIQYITIAY